MYISLLLLYDFIDCTGESLEFAEHYREACRRGLWFAHTDIDNGPGFTVRSLLFAEIQVPTRSWGTTGIYSEVLDADIVVNQTMLKI